MKDSGKSKESDKPRRKPGRVPTSCAECRRLKLRCDRNVPCEKCVQRGCGSICPDGALISGRGNRMILANTEELHAQIEDQSARIRELEDALRNMQQNTSDRPHPLLQEDVLRPVQQSASPPGPSNSASSESRSNSLTVPPPDHCSPMQMKAEDDSNVIDAFGTLTIGQHGESRFLGKTARSEYLIDAPKKPKPAPEVELPRLSKRLKFAEFHCEDILDNSFAKEAFQLLPPLSEAIRLCELYLLHGKHLYTPVPRNELFDEILMVVYRAENHDLFDSHHALALLFICFALATLFDTTQASFSPQAEEYYHLSRAALSFSPPMRETTLTSIQAMIHMAQYIEYSDCGSSESGTSWIYIGHAVRLGYSIGLHLHGARWKLNEEAIQRRSRAFWQLFVLDTWSSFYFGRPPSMSTSYIDCVLPKDKEEVVAPDGSIEPSYYAWNWKFTILLHTVMVTAFGPKQPTYTAILDLDRKIRDFPVPMTWRPACPKEPEVRPRPHMICWLVLSSKESTLLNLHRAYFAQALQEQPHDLSRHRYIPSVIAIYRSAWRISRSLRIVWENVPDSIARVNVAWSQALSAAIVMCLLITKAPTSHLTTPALEELDYLTRVFEDATQKSRCAAHLLPSVQRLRRKAHETASQSLLQDDPTLTQVELDRLGGKTHLFSQPCVKRPLSTGCENVTELPPSRSTSVTLSDTFLDAFNFPTNTFTQNLHPTIAQDIRNFGMKETQPMISGQYPFFDPTEPFYFQPQQLQQFMPDLPAPQQHSHPQAQDIFQPVRESYLDYSPQQQPPGFGAGGLVLDSTWQGFLEQLGF